MSELSELYQEVILDHNRKPQNFFKLEGATRTAEGYNPLCGDHLTLFLKLRGEKIEEVSFQGSGCAISKASASLMTSFVKGKTKAEIETLFEKFHTMVTGKPHSAVPPELGKLAVFSGVCEFPSRVKCASLAWHTLRSALEGKDEVVSTEEDEVASEPQTFDPEPLRNQIVEALKTCFDPEIPVNIYELGLIYNIDVQPDGAVTIQMTLTSPSCPAAASLPADVEAKAKAIPGVSSVKVELVWEPTWTPEKMSEAAKLILNVM